MREVIGKLIENFNKFIGMCSLIDIFNPTKNINISPKNKLIKTTFYKTDSKVSANNCITKVNFKKISFGDKR